MPQTKKQRNLAIEERNMIRRRKKKKKKEHYSNRSIEESSMFNNYFNEYARFTSVLKGKLSPKFTMLDIKLYETENLHYHLRSFLSATTPIGINKDIFHIIFAWTFDKYVMKWYNIVDL